MGFSYEGLSGAGEKIYAKAVEEHMGDVYDWFKDDSGTWHKFADDEDQAEFDRVWLISQNEYAEVPGLFNEFVGMSDPANVNDAIANMDKVLTALSVGREGLSDPVTGRPYPFNANLKSMTTAAGYLDEWDGLAVLNFKENFIDRFYERTLNEFNAGVVLINALRAHVDLWTEARLNVTTIANDTMNALDHKNDFGVNDWKMTFSVVSAVVAIGGLVVTSGGVAAIGLGAVGAATGLASAYVGNKEPAPELPLGGETARAVVDNMKLALTDLKRYIGEAEAKIQSACSATSGKLSGQSEDYVAPAPTLTPSNPDVGNPDND